MDNNGIKLVRGRDDYHPSATDLVSENPIQEMIRVLEQNTAIRLKNELELSAEIAQAEGVYVCAKDSLRVGNCLAGTLNFAKNNGIDVKRHYSANELLKLSIRSDYQRFKLVIKAACRRFKTEMERGYSLLEDHMIVG